MNMAGTQCDYRDQLTQEECWRSASIAGFCSDHFCPKRVERELAENDWRLYLGKLNEPILWQDGQEYPESLPLSGSERPWRNLTT